MFAPEAPSADAPTGGVDPPAAFGIAAVEFDQVTAALTDVDRMRINGGATSIAERRIHGIPVNGGRVRLRDLASPRPSNHGASLDAGAKIVD